MEQGGHHNLLLSIVINQSVAIPKARTIPMVIINTNKYNVWLRQPLLAAELCDVECCGIEYKAPMDQEGENIKIGFQPVPPQLIDINSCQVEAGPLQPTSPKIENLNLALIQTPIPHVLISKPKYTGCLSNSISGKKPN